MREKLDGILHVVHFYKNKRIIARGDKYIYTARLPIEHAKLRTYLASVLSRFSTRADKTLVQAEIFP